MKLLRVLVILGFVVACSSSSDEEGHKNERRSIAGRYLAWRRTGGPRSNCLGWTNLAGWNIYGGDWGCCGNYGGCCKYAALGCYLHDAACSPCCGGGHWLCGPYCKNEPSCRGRWAHACSSSQAAYATVNLVHAAVYFKIQLYRSCILLAWVRDSFSLNCKKSSTLPSNLKSFLVSSLWRTIGHRGCFEPRISWPHV